MNKNDIIKLLTTNDKAICRALVVINERQTEDEKTLLGTINANGRGFTPADAHMGTSMATYFEKWGKLSEKQLAYWKKPNAKGTPRICKYANQLLEIALQKARIDAAKAIRMNDKALLQAKEQAEEDDREMNRIVFEAEMISEQNAFSNKFARG
jgi:acetoacetate decarboxylase